MQRELIEALDRADADDEVRAIVVTGEGRGFCAGADLERGGETFDWRGRAAEGPPRDGGGQFTLRAFDCTKPLIAAIKGPAGGGGGTHTPPMGGPVGAPGGEAGVVFPRPRGRRQA